jgi:hypothetical protein
MTVSRFTLRLIEIALAAMVSAVALVVGWWLLSLNTDTTEAQMKAQMTRLEASADVYHSRLRYYQGVCGEIGVPTGYICHDSEDAFAIEVAAGNGRYLCLDSQGFFGYTRLSKGEGTTCRRY